MTLTVTLPSTEVTTKVVLPSSPNSARSVGIVTTNSRQVTSTTLDGLADVDTTGVQNGYVLLYNNSTENWEAGDVVSTTLDGLSDVDTTGVENGYVLLYNNSTENWEAGNLDGGTY